MKTLIFKAIAFLLALAFVAYVALSLAFNEWNPSDWIETNQTQADDGDNGTKNPPGTSDEEKPATPGNSDEDKPTNPTPGTSDEEEPTITLSAKAQAFIDSLNIALDSFDTTTNVDAMNNPYQIACWKAQELSDSDKEITIIQTALEVLALIGDNAVYDGYYWLSLDIRQQAAKTLINAGLRAERDIPTNEVLNPTLIPLSPEAQNFIDHVNLILDTQHVSISIVSSLPFLANNLSNSDTRRGAVIIAVKAANIIFEDARKNYKSGKDKDCLSDDARLEAASLMVEAGLRDSLSWVN